MSVGDRSDGLEPFPQYDGASFVAHPTLPEGDRHGAVDPCLADCDRRAMITAPLLGGFDQSRRDPATLERASRRDRVDDQTGLEEIGVRLPSRRIERWLESSLQVSGNLAIDLRNKRQRGRFGLADHALEELDESVFVGEPIDVRSYLDVVRGNAEVHPGETFAVARLRFADHDFRHVWNVQPRGCAGN